MSCFAAHELERIAALPDDDAERSDAVEHASRCARCGEALERALADESLLSGLRVALGEPSAPGPASGDRVGDCSLVRPLGEGGMGVVWEARQDGTGRRVALKLLRPAFATGAAVRRFEREVRLLARLDHPGIARVFEAGGIEDGRPWFTMDLVDGVPVTRWADENRVGLEGRVGVLVAVARAVQHAHEHGVIHRDLKPANILVAPDGRPRVLDFGIAILADDGTPAMRATLPGEVVGTFPYMSPEQARGERDVGTRSDVHGLGVILFELLTGGLPRGSREKPPSELLRAVSEDTARLPSELVDVPVDLDLVVARALADVPERRYASAADLADDLERFLRSEPVEARPSSLTYQASMFARRHGTLVAAAALAVLLLAGGLVATTVQARRARDAEAEARRARLAAETALADAEERRSAAAREARRAAVIREFLEDVLQGANPMAGKRRDPTVREIIDRAAVRVGERFGDAAAVEIAVRETLALCYFSLDAYDSSWEHLARAAALLDEEVDASPADRVRVWSMMALVATRRADRREAKHWIDRALAVVDEHPELAPEALVDSLGQVAVTKLEGGDPEGAEAILRRTIEMSRAAGRPVRAVTLMRLGHCLCDLQRFAEGEACFRDGLAIRRRAMGDEHVAVAHAHIALSEAVRRQGRHDEAAEHCREAVRILEVRAPAGTALGSACLELAAIHSAAGSWDATLAPLERALDSFRRSLPETHPQIGQVESLLGDALMRLERHEDAGPHLALAFGILRPTAGTGRMVFPRAAFLYATWLRAEGRAERAEELIDDVLDATHEAPATRAWRARLRVLLGRLLLDDGMHEDAEAEMLAGHAVLAAGSDPYSYDALIDLYRAWGRPAEAEALVVERDALP